MMRKIFLFTVTTILLLLFVVYRIFLAKVDTNYAINFSNAFMNYDIADVDEFLDKNTIIIWGDNSGLYKELRNNVIKAFNEKTYELDRDSSYGYGSDIFINNVQKVTVQIYIYDKFNKNRDSELIIKMEIEKIGFTRFRVKSIQSNDSFFGYLFFGVEAES